MYKRTYYLNVGNNKQQTPWSEATYINYIIQSEQLRVKNFAQGPNSSNLATARLEPVSLGLLTCILTAKLWLLAQVVWVVFKLYRTLLLYYMWAIYI